MHGGEAEDMATTDRATEDNAWTVERAARFLGVSEKTLYAWAAKGTLPSFKVGRARRFSGKALAAWRESQVRGSAV